MTDKPKKPRTKKAAPSKAKEPAKMGRPTEFKPEYCEQAAKLCALGATDYELANFFGVNTLTIYRWKNTREDFCKAVQVGKELADERVERALFSRAVGYTYESEKVFQFQGEVVRAPIVEHVPPDPGAAFNWLKNRRPEVWRDKTEVSHKHEHAERLSDEELENIAAGRGGRATASAKDSEKLH